MEAGQLWRQYAIAGIANIAMVSAGFCFGWTSPINQLLIAQNRTQESPLGKVAQNDELSWIGSLLNIGSIFGSLMAGFVASRIGRKWGLMLAMIPKLAGWILIAEANQILMIYIGRICLGLGMGALFVILPMYCAEIAMIDCRGIVGSFLQLYNSLGFLLVYGVGPYVTYTALAYLGMSICIIFLVSFIFMPETPTHRLLKGDKDRAAQSLMMLRGRSLAGVEKELNVIVEDVNDSLEKTANISDVFRGTNFKAFYMSCALLFFQQFSGICAVLFYLTTIFAASGLDIAEIATIIIGIIQVLASLITPFVVDRLGRRFLLLVSSSGTTVALVLLGMYFVLNSQNSPIVEVIRWLPVVALVLFVVTYCVGLGSLPWAFMSEVLPIEVKTAASPILTAFCWCMAFLVSKYFPLIAEMTDMYVGFFIFCGCCTSSFFFTLFFLPETKGKSLREIQELLSGHKNPEKQKTSKLYLW